MTAYVAATERFRAAYRDWLDSQQTGDETLTEAKWAIWHDAATDLANAMTGGSVEAPARR